MDEIGKRQVGTAWMRLGCARSEAREALGRVVYWLGELPKASWCAVAGRHSWGAWRESATLFVPQETRRCSRCGGYEYRGFSPSVTIVSGSMTKNPVFQWAEDESRPESSG